MFCVTVLQIELPVDENTFCSIAHQTEAWLVLVDQICQSLEERTNTEVITEVIVTAT